MNIQGESLGQGTTAEDPIPGIMSGAPEDSIVVLPIERLNEDEECPSGDGPCLALRWRIPPADRLAPPEDDRRERFPETYGGFEPEETEAWDWCCSTIRRPATIGLAVVIRRAAHAVAQSQQQASLETNDALH